MTLTDTEMAELRAASSQIRGISYNERGDITMVYFADDPAPHMPREALDRARRITGKRLIVIDEAKLRGDVMRDLIARRLWHDNNTGTTMQSHPYDQLHPNGVTREDLLRLADGVIETIIEEAQR